MKQVIEERKYVAALHSYRTVKRLIDIPDAEFPDHSPLRKIDLSDTTFIIPVSFDHIHRKQNIELCVQMIRAHFNTHIIIGEQGGSVFSYMDKHCTYIQFQDMKLFHRTRMLNQMTLMAGTKYVANWDADVMCAPLQILEAVNQLRSGSADMIYPYDGRFARVPRLPWYNTMLKYLDCGMFKNAVFSGMRETDLPSVGGAILYNKDKFIEAGMENENMISYGPEDTERKYRFETLGYKVSRIPGVLYHLDHHITLNSSTKHQHFDANVAEFNAIRQMSRERLREYVGTWEWAQTKNF